MQILKDLNSNVEIYDSLTPNEIKYMRVFAPSKYSNVIAQYTCLVNLDVDNELLRKNFSSTTRNLINKCIKSDNPIIKYNFIPNDIDLEYFLIEYNKFAENKHSEIMQKVLPEIEKSNKKFKDNNMFAISEIYSKDYPELKIIHTHSYFKNINYVRLMSSISEFREADSNIKNMIARLNRYLHYNDFLKFKELGYKIYDMGGVTIGDAPIENKQISSLKFSISKKIDKYYYINVTSDCIDTQKPKIAILYNNNEEYNICINVINQLSEHFVFYPFMTDDYKNENNKNYSLVIDLGLIDFNNLKYCFSPKEFYMKELRTGELKYCYFKDIYTENNIVLNDKLNKYDVIIFDKTNSYFYTKVVASGCYVIMPQNNTINTDFEKNNMGLILNENDNIDSVLNQCNNRLKTIRLNAYNNTEKITESYSYFTISKKLLELFNNMLLKENKLKKYEKIFSYKTDENERYKQTKIVLCGLKINFKTTKTLVAVEREREREREREKFR